MDAVRQDLEHKMVFVAGPRQVGKTTLARQLAGEQGAYLNWDIDRDRAAILRSELPSAPLVVFDELHKYRRWRAFLKGFYDDRGDHQRILVTGSARLDHFRRGGDSLQGRYFLHRMHPLSVAELGADCPDALDSLLALGGFPEPFFAASARQAKRWSVSYRSRLVREELTDLATVKDVDTLELLSLRLPELVGSPLSVNALREDLQVAHKTVTRWLGLLESLYATFRLSPFGAPRLRAVKKEQKHYHFDWTLVESMPLRFENLVAAHLLKWVHHRQDTEGDLLELRYFRDVDRREVDFVMTERRRPILAVECKWGDGEVSPALHYFKQRFPDCACWQISATGTRDYRTKTAIRVAPAPVLLRQWA